MTSSIRSLVTLALLAAPFTALAQDPNAAPVRQAPAVSWVEGPGKGQIGSMAVIDVPKGYRFCGAADTQALMKFMQNPVSGNELGFFASDTADWFIVFEFNDIGYVKDDEKDKLDGNAILASLREGNEHGNEMRRENGWPTLEIVGWEVAPKYDSVTNNLEWAVRLRDNSGGENINYDVRLLGRKGVMQAGLVIGTEGLTQTLPEFKTLLGGFSFVEGETYSSYRQGDKIAEYGLTALVTGGALAVAAKSGLLAKLLKGGWKFLVIAGVAIAGVFKKVFGKKDE